MFIGWFGIAGLVTGFGTACHVPYQPLASLALRRYTCDVSSCVIVDQVVTAGIVRREPTGGGTNRAPQPTGSVPAQTLTVGGGAAQWALRSTSVMRTAML